MSDNNVKMLSNNIEIGGILPTEEAFTRWCNPDSRVKTLKQSLTYIKWCDSEVVRMVKYGGEARVGTNGMGKIAVVIPKEYIRKELEGDISS